MENGTLKLLCPSRRGVNHRLLKYGIEFQTVKMDFFLKHSSHDFSTPHIIDYQNISLVVLFILFSRIFNSFTNN